MKGGNVIDAPIPTAGNRGWIPSDAVGDFLREVREDIAGKAGGDLVEEEPHPEPPVQPQRKASVPTPARRQDLPAPEEQMPGDISALLSGGNKGALFSLLRCYDRMLREDDTFIEVATPIGNVRCPLAHFQEDQGLLQMFLTKKQQVFVPKEGAQLVLTLHHRGETRRYGVMCVLPPIPIPGIGVDLMVFTVESSPVEKNARLEVGAPSAVSGKPSTGVSHGEAVAHGEEASPPAPLVVRDFGVPRNEQER
jgi:hypothetical protein